MRRLPLMVVFLAACFDVSVNLPEQPIPEAGMPNDDGGTLPPIDASPDPIPIVDAGSDADASTFDPFGGSTFAYVNPGVNANSANPAHQNTVESKDCMQLGCHLDGNQAFAFGGTIYQGAPNSTTTVAQAEVRITGPNGVEYARAYTDANGNFWTARKPSPIPSGSRIGVRNGVMSRTKVGTADATFGSCALGTCHGSPTLRVFL